MAKTNFIDGDPSTGVVGSVVTAALLNAINNHRHRGLDQDGDGAIDYAADTGSADACAIALTPALTAHVVGMPIHFKVAATNTGAATLAVNGMTAVAIKKNVSEDVTAGDLIVGKIVTVIYDGTNYQLSREPHKIVNVATVPIADTISSAAAFSISNTKPQIAQGFSIKQWAYTPKAPGNKLILLGNINVRFCGQYNGALALFKDGATDAIAIAYLPASYSPLPFLWIIDAGGTNEIAFELRGGGYTSTTSYVNSADGSALFDGLYTSSIVIIEYVP
jgi:hypothetical protein